VITITYDDHDVIAALQRLQARMHDMTPVMRSMGGIVRSDTLQRFESQQAPDGKPWAPLALATKVTRARRVTSGKFRKRSGGYTKRAAGIIGTAKALLDTGVLRGSIQVGEVARDSVSVGSRMKYAAIHQFGGKAGRGRKVTIPARPYLGVSQEARGDLLTMIKRYLAVGDGHA